MQRIWKIIFTAGVLLAPASFAGTVQIKDVLNDRLESVSSQFRDDPLLIFLNLFYGPDGRLVTLRALGQPVYSTGPKTPLDQNGAYRNFYWNLGLRVWFFQLAPEKLTQFQNDLSTDPLGLGIARYLNTLFVQQLKREQTPSLSDSNPAKTAIANRKFAGELFAALPKVCTANLRSCVLDLVHAFDEHFPLLYSFLDSENADSLIGVIDQVNAGEPSRWLFSAEYRRLFAFRDRLLGLHEGLADRALTCAILLTKHGARKVFRF